MRFALCSVVLVAICPRARIVYWAALLDRKAFLIIDGKLFIILIAITVQQLNPCWNVMTGWLCLCELIKIRANLNAKIVVLVVQLLLLLL